MRTALAVLLALHGAIHLLGAAKGLRLAEVAPLRQPIGPALGAAWGVAALLLLGAAALVLRDHRAWWMPALAGVVLSEALIATAWADARFGTVANVLLLVPILVVLADHRPGSLRAAYARAVRDGMAREAAAMRADDARAPGIDVVTEADLARLPPPVARWLGRAGVVGRPRVRDFHVVFAAEMRAGPHAPWMTAHADQYEFLHPAERQAERLFFMRAARAGVPFHVLHRYVGDSATMQVRVAGLVPVQDVRGPVITRSETVTLLNDLCVLAPASLVDAPIAWETLDDRTVRATFTIAGQTVRATLHFDAAGDLVDFRSGDRAMTEANGGARVLPWSTPLWEHRDFDGVRLPARAEARWTDAGRTWAYGRFAIERIAYNVGLSGAAAPAAP